MKVPFQRVTLIIVHTTVFLFLGLLKKASQEIDCLVLISSVHFQTPRGNVRCHFDFEGHLGT